MKWNEDLVLDIYDLAKQGLTKTEIAKALGTTDATFDRWKTKYPVIVTALRRAKSKTNSKSMTSFRDFVYQRLPAKLRRLWRKINRLDHVKNGIERIEALLEQHGKMARMHLFLYALVASNWSLSEACRRVNISRNTFDLWKNTEPSFHELIDQIMEGKKDFYEASLVSLVKRGDPSATIFANRTMNKDRGYTEKLLVEVNGHINHNHVVAKIEDLDLDFQTKKELYTKMKEKYGTSYDKLTLDSTAKEVA